MLPAGSEHAVPNRALLEVGVPISSLTWTSAVEIGVGPARGTGSGAARAARWLLPQVSVADVNKPPRLFASVILVS